MILAYMKLRKRNLGPILDANGWAVNAKAKINVPFGTILTRSRQAAAGRGMTSATNTPSPPSFWPKFLVVIFVIWWVWSFLNDSQGRLYNWTNGAHGRPSAAIRAELDRAKADEKKAVVGNAPNSSTNSASAPAPVSAPDTNATNAAAPK